MTTSNESVTSIANNATLWELSYWANSLLENAQSDALCGNLSDRQKLYDVLATLNKVQTLYDAKASL